MSDLNLLLENILFSTIYDIKIDFLTQRVNMKTIHRDFNKNVKFYELQIIGVTKIEFKNSPIKPWNYIELSDYSVKREGEGYNIYLELWSHPLNIKCKDFTLTFVKERKLLNEELEDIERT